jgi:prophage regulatory protein
MRQIIRLKAVMSRTGHGRSSIYEKIANGTFPRPVPMGPKAVGWVDEEIDEYITKLIAQRDSAIRT